MSAQERLNRIWYDGAAGAGLLQPFSWVFGKMVAARARAFAAGRRRAVRVSCPVIMVGNL